jgi:excisionase family DNA binding protein
MEKMLLKPDEVAAALAIGRSKAYALISDGVIPSIRIGGSVRVSADALKLWVQRQSATDAEGTTA